MLLTLPKARLLGTAVYFKTANNTKFQELQINRANKHNALRASMFIKKKQSIIATLRAPKHFKVGRNLYYNRVYTHFFYFKPKIEKTVAISDVAQVKRISLNVINFLKKKTAGLALSNVCSFKSKYLIVETLKLN